MLVSPDYVFRFLNFNYASATAASVGALEINLYVWEITGAVVQPSAATLGTACPVANTTAEAGSTQVIVICGTNHYGFDQPMSPAAR